LAFGKEESSVLWKSMNFDKIFTFSRKTSHGSFFKNKERPSEEGLLQDRIKIFYYYFFCLAFRAVGFALKLK
jgi:hypothetical protein